MKKLQLVIALGCFVVGLLGLLNSDEQPLPHSNAKVAKILESNAKTNQKKNFTRKKNTSPRNNNISFQNFNRKQKRNAKIRITIDGAPGTQKSFISKSLSEKFNLIYLESSALYKTVAYVLNKKNMEPKIENKQKIENFLKSILCKVSIKNRHAYFVIDGELLSDRELYSENLDAIVAAYSSQFESIHDFCFKVARQTLDSIEGENCDGLIAEGYIYGMKIFPEADLKFWFYGVSNAKADSQSDKKGEPGGPLKNNVLGNHLLKEPENAIRIWIHNRPARQNINILSAFIEQKFDEKGELTKSIENQPKK